MLIVAALLLQLGVLALQLRDGRVELADIAEADREALSWHVGQARFEASRLSSALASHAAAPTRETAREAQRRIDLLWSRVNLLKEGALGRRMAAIGGGDALWSLENQLHELEPVYVALGEGGPAPALPLAERVNALLPGLQAVVARAAQNEEATARALFREVAESNRAAELAAMTAGAAALLLSVLAVIQVLLDRRRLRAQRRLTDQARRAVAARSRFLAMMSHELRTPMNGVLGMLAVLEHSVLAPGQRKALSQARRSGLEMVGILEDIMDLSAAESAPEAPAREPISLGVLAAEIVAHAKREPDGPGRVSVGDGAAAVVMVDRIAFTSAVRHLIAFAETRLDAVDWRLSLRLDGARLEAALRFPATGRGWTPDGFVGGLRARGADIASESVSAALARAHIERLGGEGSVLEGPSGVQLVVSCPVEVRRKRPNATLPQSGRGGSQKRTAASAAAR